MKRWILRLPFGFTVRLHLILRSDADRHLHDHPFDFTSLLLSGGYTEITPCDCGKPICSGRKQRLLPRLSINRKRAEERHALTLERPVLTLVFAGPKRREWGFHTEAGWVHNEEYVYRWPEQSSSTRSVA